MGLETPGPTDAHGLIGRVIGGYRLARVLGTGEASVVLLGQHVDAPEQQAAIKILVAPAEASAAAQRELRAQFSHEAQALFALQHPHILGIAAFGIDVVTGSLYMALPYPHGGTLAERLSAGALPLPTATRFLAQLADALDAAYAIGIAHGDVSPANILLDEHEQVYLSGFSAIPLLSTPPSATTGATPAMTNTRTNPAVMAESVAYWAPERARGQDVGSAADIYSLGVVLYQMVTGYVPFQGATQAIVLLQHAQLPPPPPRALRPDLPEDAEAAILRALAKQPSERFATAIALAEAFARGVDGAPGAEDEAPDVGGPMAARSAEPAGVIPKPIVAPPRPSDSTTLDAAELRQPSSPAIPAIPAIPSAVDPLAPPQAKHSVARPPTERPATTPTNSLETAAPAVNSTMAAVAAAPAQPAAIPRAQTSADAEEAPARPAGRPAPLQPADAAADQLHGKRSNGAAPAPDVAPQTPATPVAPSPAANRSLASATLAQAKASPVAPTSGAAVSAQAPESAKIEAAPAAEAKASPVSAASGFLGFFTPTLARQMTLVIFVAVLGVAAIAILRVLGVFEAALMAVILALFTFIAIVVPNRPMANPAGSGERQGDGRDAGLVNSR